MVPFAPILTGATFVLHSKRAALLLWSFYVLKTFRLTSSSQFCIQKLQCLLTDILYSFLLSRIMTSGLLNFTNYQLNAQFLYSSTICVLHYDPQHVSSSTLLILKRTNCITTASGIVTLCKQPYSMQVESGLQSALNRHTVRLFTEGDDTRVCGDKICPPEDEQRAARNMLRIVV